jgi:hypothetical protein
LIEKINKTTNDYIISSNFNDFIFQKALLPEKNQQQPKAILTSLSIDIIPKKPSRNKPIEKMTKTSV